jgi:hypothetical protein
MKAHVISNKIMNYSANYKNVFMHSCPCCEVPSEQQPTGHKAYLP